MTAPWAAVPLDSARPVCESKEYFPLECMAAVQNWEAREKSLFERRSSADGGAYRVVYELNRWVAGFRVARIEWAGGAGSLTLKEIAPGHRPGCRSTVGTLCVREQRRSVTADEWKEIDTCFVREGFFKAPPRDVLIDELNASREVFAHTLAWQVEGVRSGQWNAVGRIEPWADVARRGNQAVWRCGSMVLGLAGEDVRRLYVMD